MFGWEFPPHIAGGLGTACYGMTRGLARNGVEVVFVMPRAYGDEDQRFVRVVNASDVETIGTRDHEFSEELLEKVSFIHIDSNMLPYISPEEYAAYHDEFVRSGRTHEWTDVWKQRYTFSGKYGANLMEEVARYAMVAAQVAKDLEGQFGSPTPRASPPNASPGSRWWCTCTPRSSTAAARISTVGSMPSKRRVCRLPIG